MGLVCHLCAIGIRKGGILLDNSDNDERDMVGLDGVGGWGWELKCVLIVDGGFVCRRGLGERLGGDGGLVWREGVKL